jgi:hypothetical protein
MKVKPYGCWLLLLILPLISACAGSITYSPVPSQMIKMDSLSIGATQEKTVGESMVYGIDGYIQPGFLATADYQQAKAGLGTLTYPPVKTGSPWPAIGMLEDGDYVVKSTTGERPAVSGKPVYWEYCLIVKPSGEAYGYLSCGQSWWATLEPKPEGPIFKKTDIYSEGSMKYELIYNGKSKDTIKLQYREYRNDFARPAFYQDLLYDLSESKTIGFKGMTIDVIEATNSLIRFVVRSGMN